MQSIVFANRSGVELAPLNQTYAPALLPVGGKPVIEHCLEELKLNGIREVFLVVDEQSSAIRGYLESGFRWSLTIQYVFCRPGDSPDQVRRRLGAKLVPPYLAVRGDIVRGYRFWPMQPGVDGIAWLNGRDEPLGVLSVYAEPCSLDSIAWPLRPPHTEMLGIHCPDIPGFSRLDSLREYYQKALSAVDDHSGVSPSGLERGVRLRVGKQSEVHHRSLVDGAAYIGDYSHVHEEVRLTGRVAIGHHCLIDRGARIIDSVVLDDTYVGAGLELENAVVCKEHIIRVDIGADVQISDPFLLAGTSHFQTTGPGERGFALLLLILSLPLWPIAALTSLIQNPGRPLRRCTCYGNHRSATPGSGTGKPFTAWYWNVSMPLLRNLPLLASVLAGHLRLLGRPAPESDEEPVDGDAPWRNAYRKLPSGLVSPAHLILPAGVSADLLQLMDIEILSRGTARGAISVLRLGIGGRRMGSHRGAHRSGEKATTGTR